MPPREIHRVGERGAADWYTSLPPITRGLLTCYFATGLGAYFGVLPLQYLYHSWPLIFKGLPQVWRLLTAYSFLGAPSLRWLFKLVWLVQYGGSYESAKFAHNTADGITCLGVGMMTGLVLDLLSWLCEAFIPPVFSRGFHASSIIFMFLYLWSKQNPEAQVSLFGFVNLNGKHLPFAFLLIDLLVGEDVWGDALGILMGHVYWFLTHAYPLATGRHVIRTPQWLSRACLQYGIGRVPVAAVDMVHPSDVRFRAFQGRGRRLAD